MAIDVDRPTLRDMYYVNLDIQKYTTSANPGLLSQSINIIIVL